MSEHTDGSRLRDVRVNVESMPVMYSLKEEAAQELGLNPEWQQVGLTHLSAEQTKQMGQKMVEKIASAAQHTADDRHVENPPEL